MRITRKTLHAGVAQASRHSEVNQESSTGLEPNNQILASALHRIDALALELGGHGDRLERTHEAPIADLDTLQPAPHEVGLERETNRLDLGQLRHLRRSSRG